MEYIVKMGEYAVTNGEYDIIRTFALASCVAVTVYSPAKKAAGMIHVVLPSPFDENDEADRPGYFAETGIPLLIDAMYRKYGCKREELQIQMYGGAESMTGRDVYFVGKKNINAVINTLIRMGLTISKADLRGNQSRTISMQVQSGMVEVFRQPMER